MEQIEQLLEKFIASQLNGKTVYFDVEELVVLLNYFLDENDLDNLNAVINLGYTLHPNDLEFSITICETLISMKEFESAQKLIDKIKEDDNEDVDSLKIECLIGLERLDEALKLLDAIKARKAEYYEMLLEETACMLNASGHFHTETTDFILKALEQFPNNFELKLALCMNYELRGGTKKAIEVCKELVNTDPFSGEAWGLMGRLHISCLNYEQAIEAFDFALSAENDDADFVAEIKALKGLCLYKNCCYEEAVACLEELLASEQADVIDINPLIAKCYMGMADYEQAYELLLPLMNEQELDDEVSVVGDLIYCCIEIDKREFAIELLCEALKKYPHSILEYLSSMNAFNDEDLPTINNLYPEELTRQFLSSNLHYN
jgi:tetratricopeptide (TPR) repeat protein